MYTVKEAAKQLDLLEHTIRFYTDKGIGAKRHTR